MRKFLRRANRGQSSWRGWCPPWSRALGTITIPKQNLNPRPLKSKAELEHNHFQHCDTFNASKLSHHTYVQCCAACLCVSILQVQCSVHFLFSFFFLNSPEVHGYHSYLLVNTFSHVHSFRLENTTCHCSYVKMYLKPLMIMYMS